MGKRLVPEDEIVALALVTQLELDQLGPTFRRAYLIDDTPCFDELLRAIDDADRDIWRARDMEASRQIPEPIIEQPTPPTAG
jgi:hypothetical protein